jgi:hypothetical protein
MYLPPNLELGTWGNSSAGALAGLLEGGFYFARLTFVSQLGAGPLESGDQSSGLGSRAQHFVLVAFRTQKRSSYSHVFLNRILSHQHFTQTTFFHFTLIYVVLLYQTLQFQHLTSLSILKWIFYLQNLKDSFLAFSCTNLNIHHIFCVCTYSLPIRNHSFYKFKII